METETESFLPVHDEPSRRFLLECRLSRNDLHIDVSNKHAASGFQTLLQFNPILLGHTASPTFLLLICSIVRSSKDTHIYFHGNVLINASKESTGPKHTVLCNSIQCEVWTFNTFYGIKGQPIYYHRGTPGLNIFCVLPIRFYKYHDLNDNYLYFTVLKYWQVIYFLL